LHRNRRAEIQDLYLESLAKAVHMVNRLAKMLDGSGRYVAYQAKASLCSALIIAGAARPNGVQDNRIVGLDILTVPITRVHIPLQHLSWEAQAVIAEDHSPTRSSVG
jgi:hypothetical protein